MKYIGEKIMFKVFITNLGKYTEGELIGQWLDLPCNNITEQLKSIDVRPNSKYEEAFITDYENDWNYNVGEYENIYRSGQKKRGAIRSCFVIWTSRAWKNYTF